MLLSLALVLDDGEIYQLVTVGQLIGTNVFRGDFSMENGKRIEGVGKIARSSGSGTL